MAYCSWDTDVNKDIIDSTSVTVGEKATVTDEIESGGLSKKRLTCSNPPDQFSVTMEFDFVKPKRNGYTELDLFYIWYKNQHKFGTVPFMFPAILLNSNRQKGLSQEDLKYIIEGKIERGEPVNEADIVKHEYYCITSQTEGSKSGNSQQIKMTWETYATGIIQIDDTSAVIDHIEADNGSVEVILTEKPDYEPQLSTWTVLCTNVNTQETSTLNITNIFFDGEQTAILFFDKFEPETTTTYSISIGNVEPSTFIVQGE